MCCLTDTSALQSAVLDPLGRLSTPAVQLSVDPYFLSEQAPKVSEPTEQSVRLFYSVTRQIIRPLTMPFPCRQNQITLPPPATGAAAAGSRGHCSQSMVSLEDTCISHAVEMKLAPEMAHRQSTPDFTLTGPGAAGEHLPPGASP